MEPAVFFVGDSGRVAAAQARHSGIRLIVADRFADTDTQRDAWRVHRTETDRVDRVSEWADGYRKRHRRLSFMAGGGVEASPGLIDTLSSRGEWLGTPPEAWCAARNPFRLRRVLRTLGAVMPPISRSAGPAMEWLAKRVDGYGGLSVRVHKGGAPDPGWYLQRRVRGRSWSVSFLADGRRACLLGFNRLLPSPFTDYRYMGALAGGPAPPASVRRQVTDMLDGLVRRLDLVGLCGMDFIVDEAGKWFVLEVNPRWVATAGLYGPAVFAGHRNACRGRLPASWPVPAGARGVMVYYASRTWSVRRLPSWCADRPRSGSRIAAGEPVCTLSARARDGATAWRLLRERAARMDALANGRPALVPS